ncbi:uncharacterized protein TNCV_2101921 [Trichonephila clavipes]|nr:uncharacterized protein TNCV_2101921 [Trichonephila clavipes]
MTSYNHMCCHSCNGSQESFFNKTMLDFTRQGDHNTVSKLLLPFLGLPDPRFVSSRAYLGSFRLGSWASHEFEQARGKVTANMLAGGELTDLSLQETITEFFNFLTKLASGAYRPLSSRDNHRILWCGTRAGAVPQFILVAT